jgi:hypothetical protein
MAIPVSMAGHCGERTLSSVLRGDSRRRKCILLWSIGCFQGGKGVNEGER